MAGLPDDAARQSQAHGRGSVPLSFPSQPPDIRNWFSSYQYESPEVPELDAALGGNDGSETQDPLENRLPGLSPLKDTSQDGGTALKGGCFGSRSEQGEVSATRDILQLGRSTVEQGTKRKRSLRGLFGAGFLDDPDEAAQTENAVVSVLHTSAVDHMCNFNWIGLQTRQNSHGGAAEHNELLVDSDSTIIAETQEKPRGGQETDHRKWPVNCGGTLNWVGLRDRKRNYEGAVEHSELLADSDSTIIAETQGNPQAGQETDHNNVRVNCAVNFNWIGLQNTTHNFEGAVGDSELLADSDRTIIAETQENFQAGQEMDQNKGRVNCAVNFNWIGLRNRTHNFEGAVEHSELLADSDGTIIAETQETSPGGQVSNHSKRLVNFGGTSLADIEEGFLEEGIEHSNLPVNSHSKGLADVEKPKRNLRDLFGAGFFDDPDKANDSETHLESAVQRNTVQPLSKSNAVRLPHIKHVHESTAGYSELLVNCDVVSLGETQDLPGGQVIEHNGLPVNCGATGLSADTEGFLEDGIEHSKLPANSDSTGAADIEKTGIKHLILHANHSGICSALTEERSGGDETNCAKSILNHRKAEATVATDGFIAIGKKLKSIEECRVNKIPKPSRAREMVTLQENRGILGTQNASARDHTRSPLSDRTNLSEVAGAPEPEITGKWKCPRKGKPYVAPPMKQLRLEQWVRRTN
ncbi:uncharacterized protein [Lolium perenne]|uniref:uncharacterized protein n=1 Tax=Lolium perenne TaxID=4522 RepID=UPI0021EB0B9C|nr:uncharacterized protein LOC127336560 [Lolium perenne]